MKLTTTVANKSIYVTPKGMRIGRGKVMATGVLYGMLTKGEARRIRKELRAAGLTERASACRIVA